ncbi:MAG: PIG-L family deacetylase [Cyclobacteriaceae bacterium]|nr:PIG-L family deacetylase [Cyclobacteriaceae bacterium]
MHLKKLNFLGTVLYVAAHPDDENTRAIAYLSNERLATTGYLSMTRGDGGQNLIGPEIRDQLGLIRTQELLAARRIDGGHQFFTRANDFGYSKSATETFKIWNKQEILSDIVRIIRKFQPDIILTRFPPDARAGHGHHTASAVLAQEAFDLTNDPSAFPEQISEVGLWQVKGLYTNTGRWWNTDINQNTSGIVVMDVGVYNPLLGTSYSEMAAVSRTQHKSQGFGSSGSRGEALEFFEYVKGYHAKSNILENVNTTWSRVEGGDKVEPIVKKLIAEYTEDNPAASIPDLLKARKEIIALKDGIWKTRKLKEVNVLIEDCLGLYLEAKADNYYIAPGEKVGSSFELVNRSGLPLKVRRISASTLEYDSVLDNTLVNNKPLELKTAKILNPNTPYSNPYWLKEPHSLGLFTVKDKSLIGKPENDPAIVFQFQLELNGEMLSLSVPLIYKWTDPVKGELWRPVEVVPPLSLNLSESVVVFNDASPKAVSVLAKSNADHKLSGEITLDLPKGWRSEPAHHAFELANRGDEKSITFNVFPSNEETTSTLKANAIISNQTFDQSMQIIAYDHFPIQTLLPPAEAKLVRINLKKEGALIGYIEGAGDQIPAALRNMGYQVLEMKNDEVTPENLAKLDAVVLGVRALNTNERIKYFMPDLLDYVKKGGTLVVQYNTNSSLEIDKDKFSPYPLTLSRDRVTDEESDVKILKPEHVALSAPNKITAKDFEGWVQERGLYFPNKWDPKFEALIATNDPGEDLTAGSLLVAKYGEGNYVYTGLSFFRELPEGVPGAYKLFANLVSLSKTKKPTNQKNKSIK